MGIPRFCSPYLNSIASQTQSTFLQSPNHIFNASLLANASLEVSCNASGGTSALTDWHWTHEICQDPWFQFQYSCGRLNPNDFGSSECSFNYTICRDYQSDRITDLSLHNVACLADSVMTEWNMNVADVSTSSQHYNSDSVKFEGIELLTMTMIYVAREKAAMTRFNELQEAYHKMENARLEMEEALQSSLSSIISDHPSHESPFSPLQDDDQQSQSRNKSEHESFGCDAQCTQFS
jgi:hypothetical protein